MREFQIFYVDDHGHLKRVKELIGSNPYYHGHPLPLVPFRSSDEAEEWILDQRKYLTGYTLTVLEVF